MLRNLTLEQTVYLQDAVYRTPDWSFDTNIGRYRDVNTGRFLSERDALKLTTRMVSTANKRLDQLTDLLLTEGMTLQNWEQQFAALIKQIHIAQFLLGRGGMGGIVPADYLRIANALRDEYRYLSQFAEDIAMSKLTPAQIKARARLYLNKARSSFWLGNEQATISATKPSEMRRNLAPVEHCADCIRYAQAGWQPIGILPLPGYLCECRANCRCSVSYR